MQLSEAIRLGAMLKPQAFGIQFDGVGTCANGAAMDACGQLTNTEEGALPALFPIIAQAAQCPVCLRDVTSFGWYYSPDLGGAVAHLNDDHHWTREQIADFVAGVEAAQANERSTEAVFACCAIASAPPSVRSRG